MTKKISKLIIVFVFIFFANISFAAYHEVNLYDTEIATSTTSTATSSIESLLTFPKESDGNLGKEMNGIDDSWGAGFNFADFLDISKLHFWILIIALFVVLMILGRAFSKISKMKDIVREYEEKVHKNKKINKIEEIENDDLEDEQEDELDENDDLEEEIIEDNEEEIITRENVNHEKDKNEKIDDDDEILYG